MAFVRVVTTYSPSALNAFIQVDFVRMHECIRVEREKEHTTVTLNVIA
jgi:hypothetical protein